MSPNFSERSSYEHLMNALVKQFPSLAQHGEQQVFQFVSTPIAATWKKAMSESLYNLMDTVPAERAGYYSSSASRITSSYRDFIGSLKQKDFKESDEYRRLIDVRNKKSGIVDNNTLILKQAYVEDTGKNVDTPDELKDYKAWLKTQSGDFMPPEVRKAIKAVKELEEAEEAIVAFRNRANKPYQRAVEELEKNKIRIMSDSSTTISEVPHYSFGGDLQELIETGDNLKANDYKYKITIKSDEVIEGKWSALYSTKASASFFMARAENTTELTQLINDEKYTLEVNLKNAGTFMVNRDQWYDDTFVKPNKELDEAAIFTKEDFFGVGGSLQLIPASFFIVYRPRIRLTIDRTVYEQKIKTKIGGSALFTIFGLSMNASFDQSKTVAGTEKIVIDFENNDTSAPQVIGVTSMKKYL